MAEAVPRKWRKAAPPRPAVLLPLPSKYCRERTDVIPPAAAVTAGGWKTTVVPPRPTLPPSHRRQLNIADVEAMAGGTATASPVEG